MTPNPLPRLWRSALYGKPPATLPSRKRGFALIVTIVLVAFLVLILIGLATFTRVETQVASNTQELAQARQNALFALNLAVGELQRSAGPDQRVTATATIGETSSPHNDTATYGLVTPQNGSRHWTGVWGGYRDDNFHLHRPALLNWLVSGNQSAAFSAETTVAARFGEITANPGGTTPTAGATAILGNAEAVPDSGGAITFNPASISAAEAALLTTSALPTDTTFTINGQPSALLVGPKTVGFDATPADYVLAPVVSIRAPEFPGLAADPAGYEIGRYAWWVGDEGVKARADLLDPHRTSTNVDLRRLRSQVAPRFGIEAMASPGNTLATYDPASSPSPERAVSTEQLSFLPGLAPNDVKARFHDLTTHSLGVLADVAKGGLKKDLTAGLLANSAPGIADGDEIFADLLPSPLPGTRPARLPSWGSLRSYVQLGAPTTGLITGNNPSVAPRPTTDSQMGIHPVVLRAQLWMTPTVDAANTTVDLVYIPAVVLWNPFDVTLSSSDYSVWFGTTRETGTAANYAHPTLMPLVGMASKPSAPAPTSTTPYSNAYYATGNLPIEGLGFVLEPTAIPPGEAIVFTLNADDELTSSGSLKPASQRVLRPGLNLNFLRDSALITIPGGQVGQRPTVTLSIPNNLLSDIELRSGTGFNASGRPTGPLLQRVAGVRWASPAVTGTNYVPTTGPVSTPAVSVGPGVDTTAAGGFPSGNHYRYSGSDAIRSASIKQPPTDGLPLTPTDTLLAAGLLAIMDSGVNETSSLGGTQTAQNATTRGRWLANMNPLAPEHNLAANDGGNLADAQFRSLGLYGNHDTNAIFVSNSSASPAQSQTLRANYDNILVPTDGNNAYVGNTRPDAASTPSTRCILFHLPRRETGVVSLGALQHANLAPATGQLTADDGYTASAMPAYAIGNSFADPRVTRNPSNRTLLDEYEVRGFANWTAATLNPDRANRAFHFDLSYLVNQALWDRFYFSTVPPSGTPAFPLPNPRHTLHDPEGQGLAALASDLRNFDRAAARLLVEGSFNINSTSVEAWKALLSSTLGAPVLNVSDVNVATAAESAFPRLPFPHSGRVSATSGVLDAAVHAGFRSLTATEINALATEIVRSVKLHGPFPSLARFVNRNPAGSVTRGNLVSWADYMGPLQLAIDRSSLTTADNNTGTNPNNPPPSHTGINDHLTTNATKPTPRNNNTATAVLNRYNLTAGQGHRSGTQVWGNAPPSLANAASAAPGFLTQADLLQVLGPVLSARSDTFRVRTYGEVRNPVTNEVTGRAWCEAIVQRLPEYLTESTDPHVHPSDAAVSAQDKRFGRRFSVVSFRWLSPSDI